MIASLTVTCQIQSYIAGDFVYVTLGHSTLQSIVLFALLSNIWVEKSTENILKVF